MEIPSELCFHLCSELRSSKKFVAVQRPGLRLHSRAYCSTGFVPILPYILSHTMLFQRQTNSTSGGRLCSPELLRQPGGRGKRALLQRCIRTSFRDSFARSLAGRLAHLLIHPYFPPSSCASAICMCELGVVPPLLSVYFSSRSFQFRWRSLRLEHQGPYHYRVDPSLPEEGRRSVSPTARSFKPTHRTHARRCRFPGRWRRTS